MTIYLYVKTHRKTNLKYLGKTSQDPFSYRGSGLDWVPHIKEHGNDCETIILRECETNQEIREWGRYYSKLYNVVDSEEWANRIPETGGGNGGDTGPLSVEHKKKISEAHKGMKHTEETKMLLSMQRKGKPRNPESVEKTASKLRGRKRPKEVRESISKSHQGKKMTEESKLKMSISKAGKPLSEEHRKSISDANKGKPKSDIHRENISRGKKGKKIGPQRNYICPKCGKVGGVSAMKQHHVPRCKGGEMAL